MTNINDLTLQIVAAYPFTPENYPDLAKLTSKDELLRFAIKHAMLHMDKATGTLATQCETGDHGGEMDHEALRRATAKILLNTLRLAEVLGVQPWLLSEMMLAELKPPK